jgi:hypothetical protein
MVNPLRIACAVNGYQAGHVGFKKNFDRCGGNVIVHLPPPLVALLAAAVSTMRGRQPSSNGSTMKTLTQSPQRCVCLRMLNQKFGGRKPQLALCPLTWSRTPHCRLIGACRRGTHAHHLIACTPASMQAYSHAYAHTPWRTLTHTHTHTHAHVHAHGSAHTTPNS